MCEYSDHDGDGECPCHPPTFTPIAAICSGGTITLPSSSTNSHSRQLESCGKQYSNDNLYIHACCGTMREYGDLDGDSEPESNPDIHTGRGDLFGWLLHLTGEFNEVSIGQLESCGKQYSNNDLYLYPGAGQCATTATLTVTVNAPVTPTFSPIAAICSGGSLPYRQAQQTVQIGVVGVLR
ncbi:MAG: hypothetical protein IPL35_17285 [Sphingobacteriales bacterium]|nr:hypothetical protein [Sphingobacteriales bacterium]